MPRVSACLIVRDEAALLPACLDSLRGHVDEICVVDTGSRDGTLDIAKQAGAVVGRMPWRDDFSAARNASLDLATGDWILVVDADERLDAASALALRAAVEQSDRQAFSVRLRDVHGSASGRWTPLARLFRNRPEIRYQRPVHESVMDSLLALGVATLADSGVRLLHLGYDPELIGARDKYGRNLRIMRARYRECPSDLYNIHKMTQSLPGSGLAERLGLGQTAFRLLHQLADHGRDGLPFVPGLVARYVADLAVAGAVDQAQATLDVALGWFAQCAQLQVQQADLRRRVGDFSAACEHLLWALDAMASDADTDSELADRATLVELRLMEDCSELRDGPFGGQREPVSGSPQSVATHCAWIRLYRARGQQVVAGREFAAVRAAHPEHDEVSLLCGEWAASAGQTDVAEDYWRRVSSDAQAMNRAAMWLALVQAAPAGSGRGLPVAVDVAGVAAALRLGVRQPAECSWLVDERSLATWLARFNETLWEL